MGKVAFILLLASCCPMAIEASEGNPIRKVVNMLQSMQAKVKADGVKEEALFEKFMCYCKTSAGTLDGSMADAEAKIESLTASIKSSTEKKAQTEADLAAHKESRAAAEDAMAEATTIRNKEEKAFNIFKSEQSTNIDAVKAATAAVEKGMGGSFLQTSAANVVRKFAMEKATMDDDVRQELLSFLSGKQGYAPASGEIVGILKQMGDTMNKDLSDAITAEKEAIQSFGGLMAAKKKEVATLQKQIEAEMKRSGELAMSLADMSNDLEETEEALGADRKFQKELKEGCATKTGEWEVICKTRSEELLALAETIKVLNDDDALELFKKTLPGASASLIQLQVSAKSLKARALDILQAVHQSPQLDLVQMLLATSITPGASHAGVVANKKDTFGKVISEIDEMIANLKKEQLADETKKEYCESSIDEHEDKKKVEENSISDSEKAIEDMEGAIATLKDEIAALTAGIKALDKSVAEATELRKEEHSAHEELISSNTAAKEIMMWAKNRLNKFYNPKLYKAPPKKELSAEDRIVSNMGSAAVLVQVELRQHSAGEVAPPPPPETAGPYQKKSGEGGGVIAMIDLLVAELDKEMQESKVMETEGQKEYEVMMSDSGTKRAQDSKSINQKEDEKANTEESLQAEKEVKAGTTKDLMATAKTLSELHGECDWLLKFYDVRHQARDGEIDALGKAKAVLSGADYSLLQASSSSRTFLARN